MPPLAYNNYNMDLEDSSSSTYDHQSPSFSSIISSSSATTERAQPQSQQSATEQQQQNKTKNPKKNVRFFEQVKVRRIPNADTLSVQERRRLWWSAAESSLIEREVYALAHLMESKRLPKSKQEYSIIRGIVSHTSKVAMVREARLQQLYRAVASIQLSTYHRASNDVEEEDEEESSTRQAKILFTQKLISHMCRKSTMESEQNAIRIGAMDAKQADLVYQHTSDDDCDVYHHTPEEKPSSSSSSSTS
jgi:hypothetical protein